MKHAFFKCLAMAAFSFFTITSFAESIPGATVSIQPIKEALEARTLALQPRAAAAGIGGNTYIVVVNYTQDTIGVAFPTGPINLTRTTSAKYQVPNFVGNSFIQIKGPYGTWSDYVQYQDIVSVYVSNGKYVVYHTP